MSLDPACTEACTYPAMKTQLAPKTQLTTASVRKAFSGTEKHAKQ